MTITLISRHTVARTAILCLAVATLLSACAKTTVVRETPAPSIAKPGVTAVVKRGDTLYRIASANGVQAKDLAAWNGIAEPYTIYPGQRLKLYPGSSGAVASAPVASSKARSERPSVPVAGTAKPVTSTAAAKPADTKPAAPKPAVPKPAPVPAESSVKWRWPADGELISRYVAGEPTKQGIGIAGSSGAAVRAAADGVVVYSGSGLVGYGELVIIKHNDEWLSAYGHNRTRLVNEGQLVKAGQQVAEMGRSGAPRDMLHFEVRYNGKPVDPLLYLPKR
ncbi:membrane protein [Lysobacter daejeonensis GH1-9]|uniref:Membrane protein n=1 Tax=Lysobacter daejeonensis GH1-9 TaxID=1385517 RepID=A0A0A0EY21_9GAMM|nr:peptidoglycan DD-metalloendopeptidase family protein [Lysobacter daejeonensis]KGM55389.1 membrane protein [Lysobacter daejeonensis GH1-9]